MQGKLRVYKDEYLKLPEEYRRFTVEKEDGSEVVIDGLNIGRRKIPFDDLEVVEKGMKSAKGGARHLIQCRRCGRYSIMYADNLCGTCYNTINFKKNHPVEAIKREENADIRKQHADKRDKEQELREKFSEYPYNIVIDTFGDQAFVMFGPELEKFSKAHKAVIDHIIDKMKDSHKQAVELCYKQGMAGPAAAKKMKCTRAWIYDMLNRVREIIMANKEALMHKNRSELIYSRSLQKIDEPGLVVVKAVRITELAKAAMGVQDDSLESKFQVRVYKALTKAGVTSVNQLETIMKKSPAWIYGVRGLGTDGLLEVKLAFPDDRTITGITEKIAEDEAKIKPLRDEVKSLIEDSLEEDRAAAQDFKDRVEALKNVEVDDDDAVEVNDQAQTETAAEAQVEASVEIDDDSVDVVETEDDSVEVN